MALLLLILGILPGFVWLLFYLEEDIDAEPKREIFFAFVAGSAITLVVLLAQQAFADFASSVQIADYSFGSFLGLAAIEEFFKFAAAYVVVMRSRYFDIPIDAMIYMVVVALGFATLENVFAISGEFRNAALLSAAAETATLRFVGATLLHTLASAIVGYYWAKAILRGKWLYFLSLGLVIATMLHASFNCLVSPDCSGLSRGSPLIYALLLLIFTGFFVLNDFEKLKHPDREVAPFFKKRGEKIIV